MVTCVSRLVNWISFLTLDVSKCVMHINENSWIFFLNSTTLVNQISVKIKVKFGHFFCCKIWFRLVSFWWMGGGKEKLVDNGTFIWYVIYSQSQNRLFGCKCFKDISFVLFCLSNNNWKKLWNKFSFCLLLFGLKNGPFRIEKKCFYDETR